MAGTFRSVLGMKIEADLITVGRTDTPPDRAITIEEDMTDTNHARIAPTIAPPATTRRVTTIARRAIIAGIGRITAD